MADPMIVRMSHSIAAPPEAVWRVLGDFGNDHQWNRSVSLCTRDTPDVRVGTTRTCHLPKPVMGRTEARETITEITPGRSLAYELDGPAGPFRKAGSAWQAMPNGPDGTTIIVEGRFEPKNKLVGIVLGPLVRLAVRRIIRQALREFEAFVTKPSSATG